MGRGKQKTSVSWPALNNSSGYMAREFCDRVGLSQFVAHMPFKSVSVCVCVRQLTSETVFILPDLVRFAILFNNDCLLALIG